MKLDLKLVIKNNKKLSQINAYIILVNPKNRYIILLIEYVSSDRLIISHMVISRNFFSVII